MSCKELHNRTYGTEGQRQQDIIQKRAIDRVEDVTDEETKHIQVMIVKG
jgi:hypothetical protein